MNMFNIAARLCTMLLLVLGSQPITLTTINTQAERDFRVDFLKGQLAKLQNKKGARAKAKREQFKREQTLIQNLTQMGLALPSPDSPAANNAEGATIWGLAWGVMIFLVTGLYIAATLTSTYRGCNFCGGNASQTPDCDSNWTLFSKWFTGLGTCCTALLSGFDSILGTGFYQRVPECVELGRMLYNIVRARLPEK